MENLEKNRPGRPACYEVGKRHISCVVPAELFDEVREILQSRYGGGLTWLIQKLLKEFVERERRRPY